MFEGCGPITCFQVCCGVVGGVVGESGGEYVTHTPHTHTNTHSLKHTSVTGFPENLTGCCVWGKGERLVFNKFISDLWKVHCWWGKKKGCQIWHTHFYMGQTGFYMPDLYIFK